MSQQSTLKVAACNPGSVPYVTTDSNGNVVGYDIGKFTICCYFGLFSGIFTLFRSVNIIKMFSAGQPMYATQKALTLLKPLTYD